MDNAKMMFKIWKVGSRNVERSLTERRMLRFGVGGVEHLSNSTLPHEHRRKLHVGHVGSGVDV
jgi:hypothetical protein